MLSRAFKPWAAWTNLPWKMKFSPPQGLLAGVQGSHVTPRKPLAKFLTMAISERVNVSALRWEVYERRMSF